MNASPRYDRPNLSLIEPDLPGYGIDLFIGGMEGAGDLAELREKNITTVVNCAVNLDLNYAVSPFPEETNPDAIYGIGAVRYYKLGLIDGDGNPETMMLAAFYILRGALSQKLPDRPTYPRREKGNVLVNCRGGRSRSVSLVALFLHIEAKAKYPTFDSALDHVRTMRELHPDEWFETPKPMLVNAARRAAEWITLIDSGVAPTSLTPSVSRSA